MDLEIQKQWSDIIQAWENLRDLAKRLSLVSSEISKEKRDELNSINEDIEKIKGHYKKLGRLQADKDCISTLENGFVPHQLDVTSE